MDELLRRLSAQAGTQYAAPQQPLSMQQLGAQFCLPQVAAQIPTQIPAFNNYIPLQQPLQQPLQSLFTAHPQPQQTLYPNIAALIMAAQQQQATAQTTKPQQTKSAIHLECEGCGRQHPGGLTECSSWFKKDKFTPNPKFNNIHQGMDSVTFWSSPTGMAIKGRADNKRGGKGGDNTKDLEKFAEMMARQWTAEQSRTNAHAATSAAQAKTISTAPPQAAAAATDVNMAEAANVNLNLGATLHPATPTVESEAAAGQRRMMENLIAEEAKKQREIDQDLQHQQQMMELHRMRLRTKELSQRRDTLFAEAEAMTKDLETITEAVTEGEDKERVQQEMEALEKLRAEDYSKWVETMEAFLGEGCTTPARNGQKKFADTTCKKMEKRVAEKVAAGATPNTKEGKRQRTGGEATPSDTTAE